MSIVACILSGVAGAVALASFLAIFYAAVKGVASRDED